MDGSMKVLLVEDDLELANLVVERLRKFNPLFEIEAISSGDNCLQKLSQNDTEYEAIILDSQSMELDSFEFLNKMNQDRLDTPVVIVSGQEHEQIGVEALKKGAYDYIVKDANYLSALPTIVQNTIEKHQLETKLKESQSLILNSKKRLQSTFDGITDIIYQVNRDFEIIIANKSFAEQCHTQPENLIGKHCYDVFFHCQEACFDCPVKETFETLQPKIVEKSYQEEVFEIRSYPIFNLEGEIESVVVNSKNITEKKKLEKSLIQSEKLATIGLLASGVSHEIRNPLNIIETARYYLKEYLSTANPDIEEKLEIIGKNVRRASKIINNLLEFSRNSKNEREKINVKRLIESTVSLIGKELTANNIEFNIESDSQHAVFFSVDSLKQVLLNIIINSVQAMPNGGKLTVTTQQNDLDFIDIAIRDTGIGISEENLPHIFSPFFTTKEAGVGTGLGLYISHMILERDGGKIKVESKVNEGTTFTISLPAIRKQINPYQKQETLFI